MVPATNQPARQITTYFSRETTRLAHKATIKLGELEPVTGHSKLFHSGDMQEVINAINVEDKPAKRDEVTTIVALLIASYPHARGQIPDVQWQQTLIKLSEAFARYPASIGLAAVDVAGLPAKHEFLPRIYHITAWCDDRLQRMRNARAMAMRHIAEAKRRAEVKAEQERVPEKSVEERREIAARIMGRLRIKGLEAA